MPKKVKRYVKKPGKQKRMVKGKAKMGAGMPMGKMMSSAEMSRMMRTGMA